MVDAGWLYDLNSFLCNLLDLVLRHLVFQAEPDNFFVIYVIVVLCVILEDGSV